MERLKVALWPRRSWSRSFRYYGKRLLRLGGSPHAIAAGFALGVLVSFTPFLGFHILIGALLAFVVGGSVPAAVLGTVIGNPLTFPFIWASTYVLGSRILEVDPGAGQFEAIEASLSGGAPLTGLMDILKPMLVGAVPLGLMSAAIAYGLVTLSVRAYQRARRQRLQSRRLVQPS